MTQNRSGEKDILTVRTFDPNHKKASWSENHGKHFHGQKSWLLIYLKIMLSLPENHEFRQKLISCPAESRLKINVSSMIETINAAGTSTIILAVMSIKGGFMKCGTDSPLLRDLYTIKEL